MTSILFLIWTICHNQLKDNYTRNKIFLRNFYLHFWNLHEVLNIFKKTMILITYVFPKLETTKYVVT